MANKKISQLTAKGSALAATDLIEISESDGAGGYVTKSITGANITGGNVTAVTATTPVVATGTTTPVISLAAGYGDTLNPYASKTAKHILAAPNGAAGVPTFRAIVASDVPTLNQSTTGNAATVTTNANLTGPVTSVGNATAIANGAISNAMLANGAVANLSGTNTGDNATNSQYSGLVSNATHTGDATGNVALTVKGINGTILSTLTTGILKNTTTTGVPSIAVAADFPTLNQNTTGTAANVTGIVAVANGGTGTATPSLVAGTNVTITGTFPNQTIAASGGGTQIGAQIGGGIVVGVFVEGGVNKALVASLTNLSAGIVWTVSAQQGSLIGAAAQSFSDGLTNTNAIIAQTGLPANTNNAAGLARLFAGGGYNDWYLPSIYELNMCYYSGAIVNKILGANGFAVPFNYYWSSTESSSNSAWRQDFSAFSYSGSNKWNLNYVRAVRIHTI